MNGFVCEQIGLESNFWEKMIHENDELFWILTCSIPKLFYEKKYD